MADTKISALTTVAPSALTTADYAPISRTGSLNGKVDLSLLGAFTRLTGLTTYTTRAGAAAGTSSASAINTQLSDLSTAGGGVAYLPPGFYAASAYISVPSNVRLVGAGRGSTTIVVKAAATTDPVTAGYLVFLGSLNSGVESLTLDITSAAGGDGIVFANATSIAAGQLMNYITYAAGGSFTEGETIVGGTSGATAQVIYANGTVGLSLANIVGTFTNGETITGRLSATAKATSSVVTNVAAKNCHAFNCEVIGTGNQNNQYLIWARMAENIRIEGNLVDGKTVTESGALEFRLDNNSNMDQMGIETLGCYNVTVLNNTVRNVILAGINLGSATAITNHNENVLVRGNVVQSCGHGILMSSDYSSSLVNKIKGVLVDGNLFLNCHKHGIRMVVTTTGAAEHYSNVIVSRNVVDLRGSKRDATNYGNYPLRVVMTTAAISNGCKIINNVFRGGGGKGSSTTIQSPNLLLDAHGWEVRDNTFDNTGDAATVTASGGSVRIQTSNDVTFDGNTVTYPVRLSLMVSGSLRCIVSGNTFRNTLGATINGQAFSDVSMVELTSTSSNLSFINNTIDSNGSTNPSVFGNNNGTGFEYYGNTYVGSTKALYDTLYPYVAEAGTTQTHGFGLYSPANGGASFTITNGKIWKSSKIAIRQTAGTALAFTVSVADGSFVLTPSAVFAGTSTYQWQIIN